MLFALLLQTAPAPPPEPPVMPLGHHGGMAETICPVGGERFQAWRSGTYSTYGSRPDGKPYSYMPFPFPLPECPSNRLVMFDAFTPAEVAQLATLIATPDYRELVARDEPYYRAAWLAKRIGRPESQSLWLLLRAIWSVTPDTMDKGNPALATRYQNEFAARVAALPATTPPTDRRALSARAANALRQLGRFDEAEALRRTAAAIGPAADEDADETSGWQRFLTDLAPVIAARDARVEPISLLGKMQQPFACIDAETLTAADRTICESEPVAKEVAELRRSRAEAKRN